MANKNSTLPIIGQGPTRIGPKLSLIGGTNDEQDDDSLKAIKIEHEDGSVTLDFSGKDEDEDDGPEDDDFSRNLALKMDETDLSQIATDLLDGIKRDEDSRSEWLQTRALGISLLGLKLEQPRSDAGEGSAPMEGMSRVRHPLLLEATVSFQATARGELLPAGGPVKVRNDSPLPPRDVGMGHNGGPPLDANSQRQLDETQENVDDLSQALETDFNHYLTYTATEYVPDTDRMLFYVGFGGDGFKKVYNCPLRRRPVSESIDAEDLIISNSTTDIRNCGRIAHRIRMRKSILRRMQILGAYRDVDLSPPAPPQQNAVDKKKEEISGQKTTQQDPKDRDYEIYEVYCELDLDEYAPKDFKGEGVPLPYRVTVEKDSRQVLDVRRNWKEDDEQCLAKAFFVQFPFIRGLGFYGLGYIHLLGNSTVALTAAWREMLDAGMFASFPGFLYAKSAGRQLTNQFRVPPGGGVAIDVGSQGSIRDAILPLPYKDVGQGFNAFIQHIEESSQRLSSVANISVGEGKQDVPVGTTLALIEQQTKVEGSAHKRLQAAQAEEFKLLKERFREDPEAFWRHNKKPTVQWKKDQFIKALNNCELVPVADPNNPTSLHRMGRAMAIKQLQKDSPTLYDPIGVELRVLRTAQIDPSGLLRPTPAQPPPDPRMEAIKAKTDAQNNQQQIQLLETKIKAASEAAAINDKQADRASKEKIAAWQMEIQRLKNENERVIHAYDQQREERQAQHDMLLNAAGKAQELQHTGLEKAQEIHHANIDKAQELHHNQLTQQHELRGGQVKTQRELAMDDERHSNEMARAKEKHDQEMAQGREMHQAKLEAARALAKVKKTSNKAKKD